MINTNQAAPRLAPTNEMTQENLPVQIVTAEEKKGDTKLGSS